MQAKIRSFFLAFTVVCVACSQPALGRDDSNYKTVQETPWPVAIKQQLVAIHSVDWVIRKSASSFCNKSRGGSGALLDWLASYPPESRNFVAESASVGSIPTVIRVEPDSPSHLAGIREGDRVLSVGAMTFSRETPRNEIHEQPIDVAQEALDGQFPNTSVVIALLRESEEIEVTLTSESLCSGYTTLKFDKSREAFSDRANVAVSSGLIEFLASRDELAFVVAHELAHTIFQDSGSNGLSRKQKERRADLFATHVLGCAGFDRTAGPRLMMRLRDADWQSWLGSLSHPSYKSRSKAMEALSPDLACDNPAVLEILTQKARA